MIQILKENEIVGKTIKSIGYGDNAFCIIYTDDTFCIISGTGWDNNEVEFSEEKIVLEPYNWNAANLAMMGLISRSEADDVIAKHKLKQEKLINDTEYKRYLALKKKFDNLNQ